MAMKVTITNIGTCRIAEPLAAAKRSKLIQRGIENIYGFVHTTKEALQQISFIEGVQLPQELAPYICSKGDFPEWKKEAASDLYFVEVSSTKEVHFGEHLLQLNYLDGAFDTRPDLLKLFFRLYRETDREKRAEELAALPDFANVSALEKRILLEGFVHQTTFEELRQDMWAIVRRLPGRVVFVNHINVVGTDGNPIASRAKLCGWLQQIAAEDQFTLLDPTPLVVEFGREYALEDKGRDVNHYSADFKEYYGKLLVRKFGETKGRLPFLRGTFGSTQLPASPPAAIEPAAAAPVVRPPLNKVEIAALITKISEVLKANDLDEAEHLAEELMTISEHSFKSVSMIAKVMLKSKQFDDAALWLDRAVAISPDPVLPLYELIKCYVKSKNHEKIVETADRIFEVDVETAEVLIMKMDALLKLDDDKRAAEVAHILVGIDPAAAFTAASALAAHGQLEAASGLVAACRKAGLKSASDPVLEAKIVKGLAKAGKAAFEAGDIPTAAAAWSAILLLEPDHEHAISRLLRLTSVEGAAAKEFLKIPDLEGAAASYRKALELHPNDVKSLRGLARCYDQLQAVNESATAWEQLGLLEFETEFSFRRAARYAARAGDVVKALTIYSKVEHIGIDSETLIAIGSLVRKAAKVMRQESADGNLVEALKNAKAVLGVEPLHPEALGFLRSTHSELSNQAVAELPSEARLFARRMLVQINASLRDSEERAVKWKLAPAATSQAA